MYLYLPQDPRHSCRKIKEILEVHMLDDIVFCSLS